MRPVLFVLAVLVSFGAAHASAIEPTFPTRPGQHDFLRDEVELFTPDQAAGLRDRCDLLLAQTRVPIVTVTLSSVEQYAGKDVTLEEYARLLFNHWGVGHKELNGRPWNRGILVLFTKDTGKVRVELGGGWGRARDADVRRILVERMVPLREAGDPAAGLLAAIEGLETMVRAWRTASGEPAVMAREETGSSRPWTTILSEAAGCLVLLVLVLSLPVLVAWLRGDQGNASGHSSEGGHANGGCDSGGWGGGSFDGGSFGGGSSDGGGATE